MKNNLIVIEPEIYEPTVPDRPYSNSFTQHDLAENTRNAYLSDWEDFCLWCQERNHRYLPADPCTVADYLEDRAKNSWVGISGKYREMKEKSPLKWNSLHRRLTAINKTHQYSSHPFDRKHSAIKKTMAGIKRILSKDYPKRIFELRKDPTLIEDIRKMVGVLPDTLSGLRDRALLLVGFAGALRRSEIVQICMEHLRFPKEGLEVFIPWSKTGTRSVYIPFGSNPNTCPVRTLKEWIQESGINQGAIFRAINRHGQIQQKALSDKSVALIIQRNCHIQDMINTAEDRANNDVTMHIPTYAGHSLRAGFVTTAIQNGVPEHTIMNQTGHKKSDTVKKYIRQTDRWKDNATTRLGL